MLFLKYAFPLLVVLLLSLPACNSTPLEQPPSSIPSAAVEDDSSLSAPALPATFTPEAPNPSVAIELDTELEAVDAALREIDHDLCQNALQVRAEITARISQGESIDELREALDELIDELDSCSPSATRSP